MVDAIQQRPYVEDFADVADSSAGAFAPTRRAAFDRFVELGFPTMRDEDWRFTNVAPIARTAFRRATPDGIAFGDGDLLRPWLLSEAWPRLVFINGYFAARHSSPVGLPASIRAEPLGRLMLEEPEALQRHLARYAPHDDEAFVALNTAFMADGAYLYVPQGVVLEQPVHFLFVSTAEAEAVVSYPRNLVIAEPGSQVTVIESYVGVGGGASLTNGVTELVAADNARIDHYKVGLETDNAYHVGTTQFQQSRDSSVSSHIITLGGALVRNNITTVLDGEGGDCTLNGLYLVSGRGHVDNHLRVEHAKPHCDSREFFKGLLKDHARAVFSGRIVVHTDAQKTDAKQTNMNLLLSEDAQVDTKPQLEIFADDVKCTHGATIGQVDDDAIFYLRSRGIDEDAARGVLIYAFADESLEQIRPEPLRERVREILFDRLPQGAMLRQAR